jgi:hypothetical protein
MKVGLILVSVSQTTASSRVSSGSGHAVAMNLCFWRANLCIPLLSILAITFHGISTLSSNARSVGVAGRMGEVGPPAARLSLFTVPYSHLRSSTVHPALRGQRLPPHWRTP